MEATFSNPDLNFKFKNSKISKIGEVSETENKRYSIISYSMIMEMKLKSAEEEDTEEMEDFMIMGLEETFGDGKVTYDRESKFYSIYSEKEAVESVQKGKKDWKFVVVEANLRPILEGFIPEEILNQIDTFQEKEPTK